MLKNGIVTLLLVILIVSCNTKEDKMNDEIRKILTPFRYGRVFTDPNRKQQNELYRAVYRADVEEVKRVLEQGGDPNYCLGEAGWIDSNPLNVVADSAYDTYYRRRRFESIPVPAPDVAVLTVLIDKGADVNLRPYVWERVHGYGNRSIESMKRQRESDHESIEPEAMQEQLNTFISDTNRLIEAFLKAGADPDKLGHPYPFSYEAVKARITDAQAKEYFAQGSRAINEAIKKGIIWESQVDLLLQYTKLDENSLTAAQESEDPAMIEKINKLWEKQEKL